MLELALKQERAKYNRLKTGNESSIDLKLPTTNNGDDPYESDGNSFLISQHPILNKDNNVNSSNNIKHGRQILKQYLQEIGYTDNIIDIRSSRLRSLLGLKSNANTASNNNTNGDLFNDPNDLLLTNAKIDQLISLLNSNKQLQLQQQQQHQQQQQQQQQQVYQVNSVSKCNGNGSIPHNGIFQNSSSGYNDVSSSSQINGLL